MGIKNPSVHHTNGFVLVTDWCGSKSSATNVYFALFSLSDVAQLRGACFAADLLHLGGLVTMSVPSFCTMQRHPEEPFEISPVRTLH